MNRARNKSSSELISHRPGRPKQKLTDHSISAIYTLEQQNPKRDKVKSCDYILQRVHATGWGLAELHVHLDHRIYSEDEMGSTGKCLKQIEEYEGDGL